MAVLMAVCAGPARAQTQTYLSIVDRDYAIDLYAGAVLGSGRIVGMGGAQVALAEGSAGLLANPAAPAVRPPTSRDRWDWDWHVDWLNPSLSSDFDNNGGDTEEGLTVAPVLTLGAVLRYQQWALGITVDSFRREVRGLMTTRLEPSFSVAQAVVAREIGTFTVGLGLRVGQFDLGGRDADGRAFSLFTISGAALQSGVVWRPRDRDIRIGGAVSLPAIGTDQVKGDNCDPEACEGYILPGTVVVPWHASFGAALRLARTRWNRTVPGRWRDERYLLVAADVIVDGAVEDGHGIEEFLINKTLQPSGRTASWSFRFGVEHEWKPGWLRLRAGTFWEPGRFEGISGRLHGTFGLDVRFWSFCLWDEGYRLRFSLTTDQATGYANGGVSIGLWH